MGGVPLGQVDQALLLRPGQLDVVVDLPGGQLEQELGDLGRVDRLGRHVDDPGDVPVAVPLEALLGEVVELRGAQHQRPGCGLPERALLRDLGPVVGEVGTAVDAHDGEHDAAGDAGRVGRSPQVGRHGGEEVGGCLLRDDPAGGGHVDDGLDAHQGSLEPALLRGQQVEAGLPGYLDDLVASLAARGGDLGSDQAGGAGNCDAHVSPLRNTRISVSTNSVSANSDSCHPGRLRP